MEDVAVGLAFFFCGGLLGWGDVLLSEYPPPNCVSRYIEREPDPASISNPWLHIVLKSESAVDKPPSDCGKCLSLIGPVGRLALRGEQV